MAPLWNCVWQEIRGGDQPSDIMVLQRLLHEGRGKGSTFVFNPDKHWSAAFYKGLNKLQYADGRDMVNINRDDATGFRLDTLTTCKQYPLCCCAREGCANYTD